MEGTARRLTWLALALGLALVVVLVDYVKYADARTRSIRSLRADASRTWLRDELVGRRLFGNAAPVLSGPRGNPIRIAPADRGLLLWVVDPGRCVSCFRELAATRELGRRADVRTLVVLSGSGASKGAAGAARGGAVALDPSGALLASLTGGRLAGAAVYADADGVVLAAEGFDARTTCDWSFAAAVGTLLGHTDARRVRRREDAAIVTTLAQSGSSDEEDP